MTPIFVLGTARNGTTWLVNALAKNDNISVVEHWLHHGAHEANFAKIAARTGDFTSYDEYLEFLGCWSMDDFFMLAEGQVQHFHEYDARDYYDLFFELMDRYAERKGVDYWAVKVDPQVYWAGLGERFVRRVSERYGQPLFVGIKRQDRAAVRSYISMEGGKANSRERHTAAARLLGFCRQIEGRKTIEKTLERVGGIVLSYEELVSDFRGEESRLDRYLGLTKSLGSDKSDQFDKNTSFSVSEVAEEDSLAVELAEGVAKIRLVRRVILFAWERLKPKERLFSHRILKLHYRPERLRQELRRKESTILLEKLEAASRKE